MTADLPVPPAALEEAIYLHRHRDDTTEADVRAIGGPVAAAVLREEAATIHALPVDNADVMATRRRIERQLHARADALDPL
jgi:hypothetical protein